MTLAGIRPLPLVGGVLALLVVTWVGWSTADRALFAPRAERQAEIAAARKRVAAIEGALDDRPRVDDAFASYVARTLGGDRETVDHRLRTRLNRMAEQIGLEDIATGTGNAETKRSPARTTFPRRGTWRELRDRVDFVELDGWISAEGGFEQVVALVDRIDAAPWLKRIDQVRFDPKDDGARFAVTVRLTTLFLPGRSPGEPPAAAWDRARLARVEPVLARNPFALPAPAAVAAAPEPVPVEPPAPAPEPEFPWAAWQLTGVAEGTGGPEAWLRNRNSGTTRRLALGQSIGAAALSAAGLDWAIFDLDGRRFRVAVGATMNDRAPVNE